MAIVIIKRVRLTMNNLNVITVILKNGSTVDAVQNPGGCGVILGDLNKALGRDKMEADALLYAVDQSTEQHIGLNKWQTEDLVDAGYLHTERKADIQTVITLEAMDGLLNYGRFRGNEVLTQIVTDVRLELDKQYQIQDAEGEIRCV